jgi:hypothetical protein
MSLVCTDTSARLRVPQKLATASHAAKRKISNFANRVTMGMQNAPQNIRGHTTGPTKLDSFRSDKHNDDSMYIAELEHEIAKLKREKVHRYSSESAVRARGHEEPMFGRDPDTRSTIYQGLPGPLFRSG